MGVEFSMGGEKYGTAVMAAAAADINFTGDSFFTRNSFWRGGNICDTLGGGRPLRIRFDAKSRNLYTPPVFNVPVGGPITSTNKSKMADGGHN